MTSSASMSVWPPGFNGALLVTASSSPLYDYAVSTQMRKIRLSTQQSRIMWALEEAGEETQGLVVATLRAKGVFAERAFAEDLAGLERLGYVRRGGDSVILTRPGYAALFK